MRNIKIGVSLLAVVALGGLASTPAYAESIFLVSGAAPGGESGPLFLSEFVTQLWEDVKGGIFGEAEHVTCSYFDLEESMIFGLWTLRLAERPLGGKELLEGAEPIKCEVNSGICAEPATLTAIHLPWLSEVVLVGSEDRESLVSSGSGAPGWKFECDKIAEDECVGEKGTAKLENGSRGEVDVVFDSIFNEAGKRGSCSRGGSESMRIEGMDKLTDPEGLEIEIS